MLWTGLVLLLAGGQMSVSAWLHTTTTTEAYREYNDSLTNYETDFTDAIFPIDHFSYFSDHKFRLKYLYNTTFYEDGGALFLYLGSEGPVELFADNFGLVFDIAPKFKAAVVFVEHRFYGDSLPYGENSTEHFFFQTSSQALGDISMFIPWIKKALKLKEDTPVILFGDKYGGMLAVWHRMKYPMFSTGAWASSAPLLQAHGSGISVYAFRHMIKETWVKSGCVGDVITAAFEAIDEVDVQILVNEFGIKNPSSNEAEVREKVSKFVHRCMKKFAVLNYPFPTEIDGYIPGWPLYRACQEFKDVNRTSGPERLITSFASAMRVIKMDINVKLDTSLELMPTWNQQCTELPFPQCQKGPPSDFGNQYFTEEDFYNGLKALCMGILGPYGYTRDMLDPLAIEELYGFDFSAVSNVIFTNGDRDPFSTGGVNDSTPGIRGGIKRDVYHFLIPGASHHLDVFQPNTCDIDSVRNVRYQAVQILSCWIFGTSESNCPFHTTQIPVFDDEYVLADNCTAVINGYPWGQSRGPNWIHWVIIGGVAILGFILFGVGVFSFTTVSDMD